MKNPATDAESLKSTALALYAEAREQQRIAMRAAAKDLRPGWSRARHHEEFRRLRAEAHATDMAYNDARDRAAAAEAAVDAEEFAPEMSWSALERKNQRLIEAEQTARPNTVVENWDRHRNGRWTRTNS